MRHAIRSFSLHARALITLPELSDDELIPKKNGENAESKEIWEKINR